MKKLRGIFLKNEKELSIMRDSGRITGKIIEAIGKAVAPGVPTMLFEDIARKMCADYDVIPAFLNYGGFPFAVCCSVNEVVVHGFPSKTRILKEGDIVSIDMGVIYHGFYSDSAHTFPVGKVSPKVQSLLEVTEKSLSLGIAAAKIGANLFDVSAAVQHCCEEAGFGVVRNFVGHGVGCRLHEKPEVPNYVPRGIRGPVLHAGMCLAIEPMVTEGTYDVEVLDDGWTTVTKDRKMAAHFEHSIAVTMDGPRILTSAE